MSRISDTHAELFHYTTADGLSGILESKSLRATHSSFVNDAEEIVGFYERILPTILRPIYQEAFEERKTSPAVQKERGNKSCDEEFAQWIKIFRATSSAVHDHYITSFSTPCDEWVKEHGLLSQWRAYGSDGGYAIVFDTGKFDEILEAEASHYQAESFSWVDVQYHLNKNRRTGDSDTDRWIEELEVASGKYFRSFSEKDSGELFSPLTILSTLFKHRGFEEEREVRFVLSLLGPQPESDPEFQSAQQHPIKTKVRMGDVVPFVELCVREVNAVRKHLPIKHIIVGPHRDKDNRKRSVQLLLKQHGLNPDMVTVSDISYRGQ